MVDGATMLCQEAESTHVTVAPSVISERMTASTLKRVSTFTAAFRNEKSLDYLTKARNSLREAATKCQVLVNPQQLSVQANCAISISEKSAKVSRSSKSKRIQKDRLKNGKGSRLTLPQNTRGALKLLQQSHLRGQTHNQTISQSSDTGKN